MAGTSSNTESPDVWSVIECGQLDVGGATDLDLMLPNGFLVNVHCHVDSTLAMLKQELFTLAKRLPLFNLLQTSSDYIFFTIGTNGEREELYDESRSIFSLRLFVPLLCLDEPEGNREEKELAHDIGLAIGHPLSEIESILSEEEMRYRIDLYQVTEQAVNDRGVIGYSHYAFPEEPSSLNDADVPSHLKSKIEMADLYIEVWYRSRDDEVAKVDNNCLCVKIQNVIGVHTSDIVSSAIRELSQRHNIEITENPSDLLLQIVGKRCYLTKDIKITSFEYVRSSFENYRIPYFILRRKDIVMEDYPMCGPLLKPGWVRAYESRLSRTESAAVKECSLWDLDDNFKFRVHSASHITISDIDKIYVKASLYRGVDLIVNKESDWVSPSNPRWSDGWIDFDIYLKDLVPSLQLCISLIAVKQRKKEEHNAIGWVNVHLCNWNNELIQGRQMLYLWAFPKHCTDLIYPFGHCGSNHNRDTARIEVEFVDYGTVVRYPTFELIEDCARKFNVRTIDLSTFDEDFDTEKFLNIDEKQLTDNQQEHLWEMREYIRACKPELLPVLANCSIIWNTHESSSQFYELLSRWEKIKPETALELLDYKYPDLRIREFAVTAFDSSLDDDRFQLYVMPLIQVLKYEPFGSCALARMLLKRALCNYRIGHVTFWLLRAELSQLREIGEHTSKLYKQFALLLEAYCRGNFMHLESMLRQVDMVARLTNLSKVIKSIKDKESATKHLQKELSSCVKMMENMISPLDPSNSLGNLDIENCKVFGSAKQPLRLTWTNPEPLARLHADCHQIIFKNGDDLRQDMFTLHVLRIMDSMWKRRDYDFRLSIYEVLPMGRNVGMIKAVQKCKTLFEIQCAAKQLGSTFNMESNIINKWIRNCSDGSKMYLECVDRFTASCAGYCVATYVLGIKDRHQDNIMLANDGKLFHIDFGHFLGHYKKKLGINRDRVPFVLTDHFLCVVVKGKSNYRDSHEYKKFRQLCMDAYLILHEHARLFVTLFSMMLCTGLPELQKVEDIDFLKNTLSSGMDHKQAMASFDKIFEEAFSGAWSTKTNWFFHSVRHL